jgi:hypothetical protein
MSKSEGCVPAKSNREAEGRELHAALLAEARCNVTALVTAATHGTLLEAVCALVDACGVDVGAVEGAVLVEALMAA